VYCFVCPFLAFVILCDAYIFLLFAQLVVFLYCNYLSDVRQMRKRRQSVSFIFRSQSDATAFITRPLGGPGHPFMTTATKEHCH
jgi:L-cystine uptake protein TcyP (sodium:dicarboxylate symporter family)